MGIEQTLTETHQQQRLLLDFFQNRQAEWEGRVATAEANVADYITNGKAQELLAPNSLLDPFYFTNFSSVVGVESADGAGAGDKMVPTSGFLPSSGSQSTVELVSSMWFGFEAVRNSVLNYANLVGAADQWTANPATPKLGSGGIIKQGGLRGKYWDSVDLQWLQNSGWAGSKQYGHISKITCSSVPADAGNHIWLLTEMDDIPDMARTYLFRAWVYVKSGALAIGHHAGYNGSQGTVLLTAADCAQGVADHPFQLVEYEVAAAYGGNSLYRNVTLSPQYGVENEIYIAAPYLAPLRGVDNIK